jgi:hypothetical protein
LEARVADVLILDACRLDGRDHRRHVAAVGSERRLRGMAVADNADSYDRNVRRRHGDTLAGRAEGGWLRFVGQGWEGERQEGEEEGE